jgi:hypothetical protein
MREILRARLQLGKNGDLAIKVPDLDHVSISEFLRDLDRLFVIIRDDRFEVFEVSVGADDVGSVVSHVLTPRRDESEFHDVFAGRPDRNTQIVCGQLGYATSGSGPPGDALGYLPVSPTSAGCIIPG